jgi:hypothetical protein
MAMVKIVPVRPELVAEHQAVILESLNDFDISIRMRALELISSMVFYYPRAHIPPANSFTDHPSKFPVPCATTALPFSNGPKFFPTFRSRLPLPSASFDFDTGRRDHYHSPSTDHCVPPRGFLEDYKHVLT